MRSRSRLSTKVFLAVAPLLVAIVALVALAARTDVGRMADENRAAELAQLWAPLGTALRELEDEQRVTVLSDEPTIAAAREQTEQAIEILRAELDAVGGHDDLVASVDTLADDLVASRAAADIDQSGDGRVADTLPHADVLHALGQLGGVLPIELSGDSSSTALEAVSALSDTAHQVNNAIGLLSRPVDEIGERDLGRASGAITAALVDLGRFEALSPTGDVATSGTAVRQELQDLDEALRSGADAAELQPLTAAIAAKSEALSAQRDDLARSVVSDAQSRADRILIVVCIRSAAAVLALILIVGVLLRTMRTMRRRIRHVARSARRFANDQVPKLIETIADPTHRGPAAGVELTDAVDGRSRAGDEIDELADSLSAVEVAVVEVASAQLSALRRGISGIFVTLARRNRSLIDSQLSLLDTMEAEVEDQKILSNYYKLDHLASRMRRNAESLLVLANTEIRRGGSSPTEIDDVIRAAISEVEDYRRIDILSLERFCVRANVVADLSHLLAELIDNATSFSPSDSRVQVSGRHGANGYVLTVVDNGFGLTPERSVDLNELLSEPPIIGLLIDPHLGLSVVSLLAHKHGARVTLTAGPSGSGVVATLLLPATIAAGTEGGAQPGAAPQPLPVQSAQRAPVSEPIVGLGEPNFGLSIPEFVSGPSPAASGSSASNTARPSSPAADLVIRPLVAAPIGAFGAPSAAAVVMPGNEPASLDSADAGDGGLPVRVRGGAIPPGTLTDRSIGASGSPTTGTNLAAFSNGARSATGEPGGNELPVRNPTGLVERPDTSITIAASGAPDDVRDRFASFHANSNRGRAVRPDLNTLTETRNEGKV